MTGATAKTTIKIGASHRERAAARLPLQPMFVSGGLHGHEAAAHHRMIGATELRAEKMISSGACGREPELRIAPGKHILLQPERGHIQAMDHVLARHRKPPGTIGRAPCRERVCQYV